MPYASLQDLIDRFGEGEVIGITDHAGTDAVDATVAARALNDADQIINGYLGKRYGLPLSVVPPLVTVWACHIARSLLHKDAPPEIVLKNYDAALKALRDAADGRLILEVAGIEPPASAARPSARGVSAERVFTPEALAGWR